MIDNPLQSIGCNLAYLEAQYLAYLRDRDSVSQEWRDYWESDSRTGTDARSGDGERPREADLHSASQSLFAGARPTRPSEAILQDRVDQLIRAFRVRGHAIARIDPLGSTRPPESPLDFRTYGLTEADLDRVVSSRTIAGPPVRTVRQLLERLRNTYCRSIGVQFMHVDDLRIRHWLQERMEGSENRVSLSNREQFRILTRLTEAVVFEKFVQKRFIGAKSFSLEGCESLIPLMDMALNRAGDHGVREVVIGMAHRGRLNVLANILGKPLSEILRSFESRSNLKSGNSGDVRYHQGHSADYETASGRRIHLSLCFNPSHLEFINPVALGRVRAKQDRWNDQERRTGMALLIHGDAAFAGEGIVQETLNLSELSGYFVGGTVHVIVNNQIGFTTPPSQGRSSDYATGVAMMLQIPIFHVNGEDPEAVAQVVQLALDFRQEFRRDVIIDMYGYRHHGHNEMDEPSYTQPLMYRAIGRQESVRDGYLHHLQKIGNVTREQSDEIEASLSETLGKALEIARSSDYVPPREYASGIWSGYAGGPEPAQETPRTGVPRDRLAALLRQTLHTPPGFHAHPKLGRFAIQREKMASGEEPLDWSAAEALAFASLATEGIRVRLSGQDSARGTFSHRHAVYHDVESGASYEPLQHLAENQAPVEIHNSPLSEAAVLGFEYGYSLDCPDGLILWEAQYGDFHNAAQVIVDQFIASAEDKWNRLSGLVLLLPHGFEGQGPEHSSARIERFLVLAAEHNMQIAIPSTPAQYFHLLRRQVLSRWRKPLILFTPKSLLRHPESTSGLEELSDGAFHRVLPDDSISPANTRRILICSGKIYFELLEARREKKREDVAIIRIEQLYPFRDAALEAALHRYEDETPIHFVQEEPENMGSRRYLRHHLGDRLYDRFPLTYLSRPESASPAAGDRHTHSTEQQALMDAAFDLTVPQSGATS